MDEDVGQWLKQVVMGTSSPSFPEPQQHAEPDLIFVLRNKSKNPVKRLVCAVQVRSNSNLGRVLKLMLAVLKSKVVKDFGVDD